MTSDEFFSQNKETFDLIFIDGLHIHEQVLKDIDNSLNVLNENGVILLHDCLPAKIWHQTIHSIMVMFGNQSFSPELGRILTHIQSKPIKA